MNFFFMKLTIDDYFTIIRRKWFFILMMVLPVIFIISKSEIKDKYITKVDISFNTNFDSSKQNFDSPNLEFLAASIKRTSVLEKTAIRMGLIRVNSNISTRDKIISQLNEKINTKINHKSKTISIFVKSDNPEECSELANQLAYSFKNDIKNRNLLRVEKVKTYLKNCIKSEREKLKKLEKDYEFFRKNISISNLELEFKNKLATIRDLRNKMASILADRTRLEQKLSIYMKKKSKNSKTLYKIVASNSFSQIKKKILKEEIDLLTLKGKYKNNHPKIKKIKKKIEVLRKNLNRLLKNEFNSEISKLAARVEGKRAEENAYNLIIKELEDSFKPFPIIKSKLNNFNHYRKLYQSNIKRFNDKLRKVEIEEGNNLRTNVDIINRAIIPQKPYRNNKKLLLFLSIVIVLIFSIILSAYIETNLTATTPEDIENITGVDIKGILPEIDNENKNSGDNSNNSIVPNTPYFESINFILTRLDIKNYKEELFIADKFLITSVLSGEGKSLFAANLATAYSMAGLKVLLIDCNLREPSINNYFNMEVEYGLTDYLTKDINHNLIVNKSNIPGLSIINSGISSNESFSLLSSSKMKNLIKQVELEFDLIIMDSPPFLEKAETSILLELSDSNIFIYDINNTPLELLLKVQNEMRKLGKIIDGIVINQLKNNLINKIAINETIYDKIYI